MTADRHYSLPFLPRIAISTILSSQGVRRLKDDNAMRIFTILRYVWRPLLLYLPHGRANFSNEGIYRSRLTSVFQGRRNTSRLQRGVQHVTMSALSRVRTPRLRRYSHLVRYKGIIL